MVKHWIISPLTLLITHWSTNIPISLVQLFSLANVNTNSYLTYLSNKLEIPFLHLRCPKDETVRFHSGPSTTQRFSFEAFQFMNGLVEPYLYVHCEVELCNLTDAKPSCMKDCSDPRVDTRQRRAVNTDIYDLEKGPIIIVRDSEDSFEDEPENEEEVDEKQGNPEKPVRKTK